MLRLQWENARTYEYNDGITKTKGVIDKCHRFRANFAPTWKSCSLLFNDVHNSVKSKCMSVTEKPQSKSTDEKRENTIHV